MESELIDLVRSGPWLMRVLGAVRDASLPDAWAGAGVLRDLVLGERYGPGFRPDRVRDGAVAFLALQDLSRANDDRATDRFAPRLPAVPWETTNQAPVHTWYSRKFGGAPVEPLAFIRSGVGTWPETAEAVRVTANAVEFCAPVGLENLPGGIWRRNPHRISIEHFPARLARHNPHIRWPYVPIGPPDAHR